MPPRAAKRKSDVVDSDSDYDDIEVVEEAAAPPAKKRARKTKEKDVEDDGDKLKRWQDVKLEGEDVRGYGCGLSTRRYSGLTRIIVGGHGPRIRRLR